MACNANKAPFLRIIAKRGYASAAAPRPVGKPAEVKVATANNNVVVATAESALPVSRVSLVFRAGSRFENYETLGASHMCRIAAGLTTKRSSGFAAVRNIQQVGGNLIASSDRETVTYTVEARADNIEVGLKFLQNLAQPAFKPWELSDSEARIRTQVAAVPPSVRAIELLHKAAFRNNLGNSTYIPQHQIGKISSETLLHYVNNHFTAKNCAVVGIGVDQNALLGFAQQLELCNGSAQDEAACYYGGDQRIDVPGNWSTVAVGGPAAGLCDEKEALAFAVLQYALGSGPVTKRGKVNGGFGKALGNDASFAAFNAAYADAGLFGFVVSADNCSIGKAVESLTRVLKSGSVSEADVNRGKAALKAAVLESYAQDQALLQEMALQSAILKKVSGPEALTCAIDGISAQDVQAAAKKAGCGKLSVGAIGNLSNVPYSTELA